MRILLVLLLSFSFMFSGCSAIGAKVAQIGDKIVSGDLKVKIAVEFSVRKLISNARDRVATKSQLVSVASGMKSFFGGGDTVLLDSAMLELRKSINWESLDDSETALALSLLELFRADVESGIKDGIIDKNAKIKVDAFANLVINTAKSMI